MLQRFHSKIEEIEEKYADTIPYLYMLGAAVTYSVTNLSVKVIKTAESYAILYYRSLVIMAIIHPIIVAGGQRFFYKDKKTHFILVLRGILGFITIGFVYTGMRMLNLSDAIALVQTAPMWTGLIGIVWLKEKITLFTGLNVVLCFSGMLFIAKPGLFFPEVEQQRQEISSTTWYLGVFLCLSASITRGTLSVAIRGGGKKISPLVYSYYFALACAFGCPVVAVEQGMTWLNFYDTLLLVWIGIGSVIGQLFMTRALQLEKVAKVAALAYTQIMFASLFDIYLFGLEFTVPKIIGICLILSCAVTMIFFNKVGE